MAETSTPTATGLVAALWRHPIKGFTPEPLEAADLPTGGWFPGDRMFAIEDGPSGFDRAAPEHLSKSLFTVLMRTAEVAGVRTSWNEASRTMDAVTDDHGSISFSVDDPGSRGHFTTWLEDLLGDAVSGPLRLVSAEGLDHRFMDDPRGRVSILNLASVRDFETREGRRIDPRRFRANIWVEGWPAWIENEAVGGELALGSTRLRIAKPITRCAATHVDPDTARRDFDLVPALFGQYGHRWCGVYAAIEAGGQVRAGDRVELS